MVLGHRQQRFANIGVNTKAAGLGIAWLGGMLGLRDDGRCESTAQLWEVMGREASPSGSLSVHVQSTQERWGKVLQGSALPLSSQRPSAEDKGKGHCGNFSFTYIFNLKICFCCAALNSHILEVQWRKGCGDSGNLSQIGQLW